MKTKIAVLFGGRSSEHEISILSGTSILRNLSDEKYIKYGIYISKEGKWFLIDMKSLPADFLSVEKKAIENLNIVHNAFVTASRECIEPDIIFPALHGPYGEDGTVQGLFEVFDIPFAGCGVLSSALAMDKISSKRIFAYCKLPTPAFVAFYSHQWKNQHAEITREIEKKLKYPVFVKPSNLGSSIGITKVHNRKELTPAVELAVQYDKRILVEKGINAREIECSVMGNENPVASLPGEIVPAREFYDYAAKYEDNNTRLQMPAKLTKQQIKKVQHLSIAAYCSLNCEGFARVDFLMDKRTHRFYISEINTIPGFTQFSMYHCLWSLTGMSFPDVLDKIIEYARLKGSRL